MLELIISECIEFYILFSTFNLFYISIKLWLEFIYCFLFVYIILFDINKYDGYGEILKVSKEIKALLLGAVNISTLRFKGLRNLLF